MMNVSNFIFLKALAVSCLLCISTASYAQGLDSNANSKVNNALARRWTEDAKADQKAKSGYDLQQKDKVLNVGRGKSCNLNVGTRQPGQKGDVIVTTKEVINVCK